MNTKQYLRQAYRLDELICSDLEELERLHELATSIKAVDMSSEKVTVYKEHGDAPFVDVVLKIVDFEQVIKDNVDRLLQVKKDIRNKICNVADADERLLLKLRYINYHNWEEISKRMNLSPRSVHRCHGMALQRVKI